MKTNDNWKNAPRFTRIICATFGHNFRSINNRRRHCKRCGYKDRRDAFTVFVWKPLIEK